MNTLLINPEISDLARREALYQGKLITYTPSDAENRLIAFADILISEAFEDLSPELAQWKLPVQCYVDILKSLKPTFIHHPESKKLIQQILLEKGCDLEKTYFDVPRLRTSTSDGYLTSGIAYAFHPHRDTWYAAPMCQINWWAPVYPISSENGMAFHLQYWDRPIKNDSHKFSYEEWKLNGRKKSAKQVGKDLRWQPKPLEALDPDPKFCIVPPPGGLLLFSAAHLHSTIPNTSRKTRFSIDFRTLNIDDLAAEIGAPNIDTASQDLTTGDFIRASDFMPLDEKAIKSANKKLVLANG